MKTPEQLRDFVKTQCEYRNKKSVNASLKIMSRGVNYICTSKGFDELVYINRLDEIMRTKTDIALKYEAAKLLVKIGKRPVKLFTLPLRIVSYH